MSNGNVITRRVLADQDSGKLPRLAVSVAEFGEMLGLSERSAWTILKNERISAETEKRPNLLPLIDPIAGGQTRRLRISDIQRWLDERS